ncbi:hypothetical protein HJG54_19370 [Leptolyngbya sp. NK1-12]|uniref:Uncharacterized protein n=1 Tax=Leptolyngbya sp. NK1-12 TaxID=2547451 RepID=A0AA96WGT2_9CYAN|nr:hypothetical protein [Leptolyngbya sp. NK1-12]WNZ24790.1 hypothetical protein HJG54_19370 [Leptolyngbya sp. NK1-12]
MTQLNFSEREWSILMQAPKQAIMAMTLADKTDPVSFLQEVQAGFQLLAEEQQRQDITNDLIQALLAAMTQADAQSTLQGSELQLAKGFSLLREMLNFKNAAEGRQNALAHFEQVGQILGTKTTGMQAIEFKEWVMAFARKVAESVREGGLFGIGVSEAELTMLKKMEQALAFKR